MNVIFLLVCFTPIAEIADVHVIVQQASKKVLSKRSRYVTKLLYKFAKSITKSCYNTEV